MVNGMIHDHCWCVFVVRCCSEFPCEMLRSLQGGSGNITLKGLETQHDQQLFFWLLGWTRDTWKQTWIARGSFSTHTRDVFECGCEDVMLWFHPIRSGSHSSKRQTVPMASIYGKNEPKICSYIVFEIFVQSLDDVKWRWILFSIQMTTCGIWCIYILYI